MTGRYLASYIYIDVPERRPLSQRRACCSGARPHHFAGATLLNLRSVERVAPRHASITLQALRLRNSAATSAFAPRHITWRLLRLRNPVAQSSSAPQHLRITLRLLCLRYSAVLSAVAPLHPASLCRRYVYDTLPHFARSLRGTPHHFAVATPTKLRSAERVRSAASPHHVAGATPKTLCSTEYAALQPGRIWSRPTA